MYANFAKSNNCNARVISIKANYFPKTVLADISVNLYVGFITSVNCISL